MRDRPRLMSPCISLAELIIILKLSTQNAPEICQCQVVEIILRQSDFRMVCVWGVVCVEGLHMLSH